MGVRLSGTDFIEGGIDQAEAAAIAQHIEPLVDFVDVSMGSYWRFHKFLCPAASSRTSRPCGTYSASVVGFVPSMALRRITPTEVELRGIGNDLVRTLPADTVVIATYHEPAAELADHLRSAGIRVHLAGNVTGTDSIQAAIHGAAAVARAI